MHTPGPWEFRKAEQDGVWTIFADGGSIMWDAQYSPWVPDKEADWHLIAAAPELLEALQRVLPQYEALLKDCGLISADSIEKARATIAKAKGEQQ